MNKSGLNPNKSQTRQRKFRLFGYIPQLFVLTILPLTALLFIITFGSVALHQQAMRNMVGEQSLRAVRANASALSEQLNHRAQAVQNIAVRAADGIPPQIIFATTSELDQGFEGGILFTAYDGTPLAETSSPAWIGVDPAIISSLLSNLPSDKNNHKPVFSSTWIDPNNQEAYLLAAANGGPNRAVMAGFSAERLADETLGSAYTDTTPQHQHINVTLIDPAGVVLYRGGGLLEREPEATHLGYQEARQGEAGVTHTRQNGDQVVVAYSPVEPLGWALILEEPWEAMANPLLQTTQTMPLVLVPALILALVGLWFGAKQVIQPLQALEEQAKELSSGRFNAIQKPVGGIDEIQRVQVSLAEMARKVQAAQDNLHSYVGAITSAQEDERRRLAREIHDDTLQAVIALNQRVQLAQMALEGHPVGASLAEIQDLTDQTIQNLRRLMQGLRPAYLEELGLTAALGMLAKETSQADGVQVTFSCEGDERRLTAEAELTLYRMAQEGLNNITRHAQADQAWLTIFFLPEAVKITIEDNGQGFILPENPGDFAQSGHFGVLGMYERAELIGAQLEVQSSPGKGTRIEITLPY